MIIEKNKLKIKQLDSEYDTPEIDLFVLPDTLQKMFVIMSSIYCSHNPISLPNLKYLRIENDGKYQHLREVLGLFSFCYNLTDLVLDGVTQTKLCTRDIPKSVKRLKLICGFCNIVNEDDLVLQLDTFIVIGELRILREHLPKALTNIKTKSLVVSLLYDSGLDINEIIPFVNSMMKKIEKFVIGFDITKQSLHNGTPVVGQLSQLVDKISNYCVFENGRGKAISGKEFEILENLDESEYRLCDKSFTRIFKKIFSINIILKSHEQS